MMRKYWSVPILDQSSVIVPGSAPGQRIRRTTTIYDLRNRRLHALDIRLLRPVPLLKISGAALLLSALIYIFTFFVPGIVIAVTKDKSLSWIFGAWAVIALIAGAVMARKDFLSRRMLKSARAERGVAGAAKIQIVPEERWDRWVSKLK